MFSRLSNSWALVKASAHVLKADKELIIFPLLSSISMVLVMVTFAVPTFAAGIFDQFTSGGQFPVVSYVIAFFFYLTQYMVIIFFNSALMGAATIRLKGGDPSLGDGLRIALEHLGSIVGYAAISATVGLVLRWLAERGWIGQIVSSLFGLAWNLAVFLAIPVLVVEGVGPVEAIKRSTTLLKETWGEQIAGNFGMGLVFGLMFFALFLVGLPIVFVLVGVGNVALTVITIALFVLSFMLLALIQSTLTGIYTAAVYQYAVTGKASEFFDEELVINAFKLKEKKSRRFF